VIKNLTILAGKNKFFIDKKMINPHLFGRKMQI